MSHVRSRGTAKKLGLLIEILLGIGVSVLTWGALDRLQLEAMNLSNNLRPATAPMLMILFIGFLATILLHWSVASLLAASILFIAGIVVGSRLPPFIDSELALNFLRGAANPGVYVLLGSWLAIGGLALRERLRQE